MFSKIIGKEIPAEALCENEHCIAFHDVNPQGPTHFLVIARVPIPMIQDVKEDDKFLLRHLLYVASKCASDLKFEEGYRVAINNGKYGA